MPRTPGTLNHITLRKIELYLAGDTSINIPPKVWETYEKNYVKKSVDPQELQDAIEMTFIPEKTQTSGNAQIANPFDDVIPDEDGNTPPWEQDESSGTFVKDSTLGVSEDFGEQIDESHENAFLNALNEQITAGATPEEANPATETPNTRPPQPVSIPPIKTRGIKVADTIKVKEDQVVAATPTTSDTDVTKYGQTGWTNYILDYLTPNAEKVIMKDGSLPRPKCMGLRRMVEQHIGIILCTDMNIVATPNRENCGIWAIQAKVKVRVTNQDHPAFGDTIEWTDIANSFASMNGQSDIVTLNPVASAYTAALSRCFRSLLGLSGVYTSEEMSDKGKPQQYHDPDNKPTLQDNQVPITEKQITFITNLSNQLGIDYVALAREVCNDNQINALTELSAKEGFAVQKAINTYQHKELPKHLKVQGKT